MPEIRPFRAIRYDASRLGNDLSRLVAPPYDVLDQNDKDALLARHERNIVAIDLPHVPPKSAGPPEVYEQAAGRLSDWLGDGTLIREPEPALYLYHQRFEHEGRRRTRRMFVCAARLSPFSEGRILPHEHTFAGPKEDRLALMKATRCNLSPILGLFSDPADVVNGVFLPVSERPPDATALLDGVENRFWVVTNPTLIERVVATLADKRVYIADGHHRYGTALAYRDWLTEQSGSDLPWDHPANYVMLVLAGMEDPGCLILPYHRVLAGVSLATLLEAWAQATGPVEESDADAVLVEGSSGTRQPLSYTRRDRLREIAPGECEPWYRLDAAYLHRCLIDDLLARRLAPDPPRILYAKSKEDAMAAARRQSGVALLVNATPMAHLQAVAEADGVMPQKSTFFHPKLATGLAVNPLEP